MRVMQFRMWIAVMVGLLATGCSKGRTPVSVVAPPTPPAIGSTPIDVVTALQQAYSTRNIALYRKLFTADFTFDPVSADPTTWPSSTPTCRAPRAAS